MCRHVVHTDTDWHTDTDVHHRQTDTQTHTRTHTPSSSFAHALYHKGVYMQGKANPTSTCGFRLPEPLALLLDLGSLNPMLIWPELPHSGREGGGAANAGGGGGGGGGVGGSRSPRLECHSEQAEKGCL